MIEVGTQSSIRLHISPDLPRLSEQAARAFADIHAGGGNRFYVVPGGQTPALFYSAIRRLAGEWQDTRFILSDERLVAADSSLSNQRLFLDQFLNQIRGMHRPEFFRLDTEALRALDRDQVLPNMAETLSAWGEPQLAILGLGADGHTASLFPADGLASGQTTQPWHFARKVDEPFTRISLTFEYLRKAKRVFFLVSGKGKARALADCLNSSFRPEALPAQVVLQRFSCPIDLFCDEAAASLLQPVAASF
ncbi:MAG: 6-phosphogluconolactonase [bacterium]